MPHVMDQLSELRRLQALTGYEVLDSEPEPEFDELTQLATRLLSVPMAVISLMDRDRQWFKSRVGTDLSGTSRAASFCDHATDDTSVMMVEDARLDPRFAANPMVLGPPHLRFYAGAPVVAPGGERLGTFCVLDVTPRPALSADEQETLTSLARIAAQQLENRKRRLALVRANARSDRIKALQLAISDAPTCELALERVLSEICGRHGAVVGHLQRLDANDRALRRVARYSPVAGEFADYLALDQTLPMTPDNSLTAQAMVAGQQRLVDFTRIDDLQRYPFAAAAHAHGLVCQVVQPIDVSGEQFALTVSFDTPRQDLAAIAADIASLVDTIRPALYRKLAEARTRLLSTALDRANDGVLITEAETALPGPVIVYANASVASMTGYGVDELIGRTPRILQGEGTDRRVLDQLAADLRAWRPSRVELLNYRRDGTPFWAEIDLTPIADETGFCTHWVSIQRDVTQRRADEEARRLRDARNRLLFDQNPLPMWVVDQETHRFLDVNEAAVAKYGWSRQAFLERTAIDIRSPEERDIGLAAMSGPDLAAINSRVWRHVCADGRTILARKASHAMVYEGRDARMSVVWDVTETEAARQAQADSNARLADMAAELQIRTAELVQAQRLARLGTWRRMLDVPEATWSDEMFEIIGRSRHDFIPTFDNVVAVIHPEDRATAVSTFRLAARTGDLEVAEFRMLRPTGEVRHCRWEARVVRAEAGHITGLFGFCQDVTERKQTEEALLRSEKLKTLGQLTGGIAHDFNNLLTVVTLNLEEALGGVAAADPLQEMLQPALHASVRGAELTGQLLAYARRAMLRPERVRLTPFLAALRPLLTRAVGEPFDVKITVADDAFELMVDPGQLENALLNLVINARDAMPDGGVIRLEAVMTTLGHHSFTPPEDLRPGRYIMISVSDQGTGIPPEVLARAFEPFFTTKEVGHGSGLGLSMVYGFAKQSGGHATIHSALGRGTAVRLYLPRSLPEADVIAACVPAPEWRADGLRVLVVEDQPAVLATVARMMQKLGFTVVQAMSVPEAQQALQVEAPFDLLFTDIVLPGAANGLDLAAMVRETAPQMRVLLTSGFTRHSIASTSAQAPGSEFLMKPYKRADLHAKLRALFPQGAYIEDDAGP